MSFGNILKKIRQDNNLTQEELAKKIKTSRSNIANYENNKNMPSVEILNKLSKEFNCSIDYLMGKSDFKTRDEQTIFNLKNLDYNIIRGFINDNPEEFKIIHHNENKLNNFIWLFTNDLTDEEYSEFVKLYLDQFNKEELLILKKLIKKTFPILTQNQYHLSIYNKLINLLELNNTDVHKIPILRNC